MDLALSRRSTKYRSNQIWWQMPELNPPIWYRLLPILGELSKVYKNHDIYFESLIVSDIRDRKDSTKQPPTRSTHGQPHHRRLLMCSKLPFLRFFTNNLFRQTDWGTTGLAWNKSRLCIYIIDGYIKIDARMFHSQASGLLSPFRISFENSWTVKKILGFQPSKRRPFPIKTAVISVLGIYIYIEEIKEKKHEMWNSLLKAKKTTKHDRTKINKTAPGAGTFKNWATVLTTKSETSRPN